MSKFSVPRMVTQLQRWIFAAVPLLITLLMLLNLFVSAQPVAAQANIDSAQSAARPNPQTPLMRTVSIPSNFIVAVDSGGVNDVNAEQSDLTQLGRDDTDPLYYELFWSWDTTNFTA